MFFLNERRPKNNIMLSISCCFQEKTSFPSYCLRIQGISLRVLRNCFVIPITKLFSWMLLGFLGSFHRSDPAGGGLVSWAPGLAV